MEAYKTQSPDTGTAAERVLFEHYRRMEPWQRVGLMFELQRMGDEIALLGIRRRHPGCPEHEARLRLAALKYGRELMVRAYGWDPEVEGW